VNGQWAVSGHLQAAYSASVYPWACSIKSAIIRIDSWQAGDANIESKTFATLLTEMEAGFFVAHAKREAKKHLITKGAAL